MNKIYTYTSLSSLKNSDWFNEIKNYPQITVSSELRLGINNGRLGYKYTVFDFRQIQYNIVPSWTTDETKFQETALLSQFLRERIQASEDEEERKWLTGCKRNKSSILSAIILLEEAKVNPEDLIPEDKNMELFVDSWRYLLDNDPEIQEFRQNMDDFDSVSNIEKLILKTYGNLQERKIVLHGFYYFTPIQKRVFEILEKHGFEFIYLFPYDQRYKVANEIWTQTYSTENGFDDEKSWIKSGDTERNAFGDLLEGKKAHIGENVRIIEYNSIIEFVNDMKRSKKGGYTIYSSAHNRANDILKDFYPEEYGGRKLLSYPVGQFIYTLNKMWDDEQGIVLDEDSLRHCFSSGWISIDGVSSKEYMKDLEYILPFFEKCRTADEWNERLGFLEEIDANVIEQFRSKLSIHPEADLRWQEVYNNPFNSFSMFAIPKERLNMVISFISKVIEMACELFGEKNEIVIGEHIRKLDHLLKENENTRNIYAEERKIIDELFKKFNKTKNSTVKCFPSDIAGALSILMEGVYEEEDEQRYSSVGMVYPLFQVEVAGIDYNSKIHICLADVKNLPGSERDYVWPLTEKVIDDTFKKTGNTYLELIKIILQDYPIINRYFLYNALQNKNVEISWINDMNGKLLTASPYIQIMKTLGGATIEHIHDKILTKSHVDEIEVAVKEISKYKLSDDRGHLAKEAKMDYAVCPMKYVYGYLLQKYPVYKTTFLQNYAVNGLTAAIYYLIKDTGISVSEIQDQVLQLFPNLRDVEKRQIKDYLKIESDGDNTDMGMTSDYADVAYTDERLKIKFPNKKIRDIANEKYGELLTPSERKDINLHEPTDIENACVFCQHSEYCKNAVFVLDQEEVYD